MSLHDNIGRCSCVNHGACGDKRWSCPVHGSVSVYSVYDEYQPRTALGRRLKKIRRIAIDNGQKLFSSKEIDEQLTKLRG